MSLLTRYNQAMAMHSVCIFTSSINQVVRLYFQRDNRTLVTTKTGNGKLKLNRATLRLTQFIIKRK